MNYVYDANFFAWNNQAVRQSAREIVAIMMTSLRPRSVLDVGCGQGVWLRAWQEAGATKVLGLDGAYLDQERLLVPRANFIVGDLSQPFDLGERFDLVQSLEVAEHLRPSASTSFVDSLNPARRRGVVFGIGPPTRRGIPHQRAPSGILARPVSRTWIWLLRDPIRPAVQGKPAVQAWYQNNTALR